MPIRFISGRVAVVALGVVCAAAAGVLSMHNAKSREQPAGDTTATKSEHIDPYEVTLSNLDAFKEQMRRDLPVGTLKEEVETYLTRWKISHQFYGPNIALRSSRNTFYALLDNLGPWVIGTIAYMAKVQIQIHLDEHEKVRDIEFRVQY